MIEEEIQRAKHKVVTYIQMHNHYQTCMLEANAQVTKYHNAIIVFSEIEQTLQDLYKLETGEDYEERTNADSGTERLDSETDNNSGRGNPPAKVEG